MHFSSEGILHFVQNDSRFSGIFVDASLHLGQENAAECGDSAAYIILNPPTGGFFVPDGVDCGEATPL